MTVFPWWTPTQTPYFADWVLLANSITSEMYQASILDVILEWLGNTDSDHLSQGTVNLYLTPAERAKLLTVHANAEQNIVLSVNGQVGNVVLNQDDIGDGTTYKQTENNYTTAEKTIVANASTHMSDYSNPHVVTKTQLWLGNVTDDAQMKRGAWDISVFPAVTNPIGNDILLIEQSANAYNKAKVTLSNLAQTIWSLFTPIAWWVDKSVAVSGGKIELVNDQTNPTDNKFYGKKAWVKGRYFLTDIYLAANQAISTLSFIQQNIPTIPVAGQATIFLDQNDGQVKVRKHNGAVIEIENQAWPCTGCFTCNDVSNCIAGNISTQDAISVAIDNNLNIQSSILAIPWVAGNIVVQNWWVTVDPAVTTMNFTGWSVTVLETSPGIVEIQITGGMSCSDVVSCVENATDLDLSNVNVALGSIAGDITFVNGTTIDWTNTTNSGIQNYSNTYTANYTWSTINNIWSVNNYDSTSIINNNGNTINNVGVVENYDSTSVINNSGTLNITNLVITWGWSITLDLVALADVDDTGLADQDILYRDLTAGKFKFKPEATLPVFIKKSATIAMSGTSLDHTDTDSTIDSVITWTADSEPNGFIEVDVGTAWHIIFTSTANETCSFTYILTK